MATCAHFIDSPLVVLPKIQGSSRKIVLVTGARYDMFCTFLYYTFGVACNVSIKGFIQQICVTDFYLKSNGKSPDFLAVWHKARAAAAACGTMAPKRAKVRFCIRSGPA